MSKPESVIGKPVAGILKHLNHTYYDKFFVSCKKPWPVHHFFQLAVGQFQPGLCAKCGTEISTPDQRTAVDTNLEMSGCLPAPRSFMVEEFRLAWHKGNEKAWETFENSYTFTFTVGIDTVVSCPLRQLSPMYSGSRVPANKILIEPMQYFCGTMRAEVPVDLPCDLIGELFMEGVLRREVA